MIPLGLGFASIAAINPILSKIERHGGSGPEDIWGLARSRALSF